MGFSGIQILRILKHTPLAIMLVCIPVLGSLSQTALKTCIYSNSSETKTTPTISDSTSLSLLPLSKPRPQPHPLPMYGFTVAPDDDLEPRELRLVAMHLSRWEEVGMKLGLDQETLDQCKKSNRWDYSTAAICWYYECAI